MNYFRYAYLSLIALGLLTACKSNNSDNFAPITISPDLMDELDGPPPPRPKADTTTPFEGAMRQALKDSTAYAYWQPEDKDDYPKGSLILSYTAIFQDSFVLVDKAAKPWTLDEKILNEISFLSFDSSEKDMPTWLVERSSRTTAPITHELFELFWLQKPVFFRYLDDEAPDMDFISPFRRSIQIHLQNEAGQFIAKLIVKRKERSVVADLIWKNTAGKALRLRLEEIIMSHGPGMRKPILYLYPPQAQTVKVKLDLDGQITHSYPRYPAQAGGWEVQAQPNGDLTDLRTGKQYYALYWEAEDQHQFRAQEGFVVKGEDTEAFLDNILAEIGLNRREAQEFVMYWLPELEANPYNLIHFATEEYSLRNRLNINPKPDALLRLLMVYTPLSKPIEIAPQRFPKFERKGFTAVEWGGKRQARLLN